MFGISGNWGASSIVACFPRDYAPPEGELIPREIGARHRGLAQEHLKGEEEGHGYNELSAISLCLGPQGGLTSLKPTCKSY